MIFRYKFSDVDIRKIGVYQFITSNFYEIDDDKLFLLMVIPIKINIRST